MRLDMDGDLEKTGTVVESVKVCSAFLRSIRDVGDGIGLGVMVCGKKSMFVHAKLQCKSRYGQSLRSI